MYLLYMYLMLKKVFSIFFDKPISYGLIYLFYWFANYVTIISKLICTFAH